MRRWLIVVGALGIAGPGCSSLRDIRQARDSGDLPAPKVVRNALNNIQDAQNAMDSKVSIPGPSSIDDRLRQTGGGPGSSLLSPPSR